MGSNKVFLFFALLTIFHENSAPSPIEPQRKIIGGSDAGEVSHQVTFRTLFALHWCGGSIINKQWVLTAAHCLYKRHAPGVTVMAGSNFLNSGGVFHTGKKIILHPSYDRATLANDVGLLQVATPFVFTSKVQQISLGSNFIGGGIITSFNGWGSASPTEKRSNVLQTTKLTTLTTADCKSRLAAIGEDGSVFDHKFCTFTRSGQGACAGDAGGALTSGLNTQIGIFSKSVGECASGYPDIFDRVSVFRSWIFENAVIG